MRLGPDSYSGEAESGLSLKHCGLDQTENERSALSLPLCPIHPSEPFLIVATHRTIPVEVASCEAFGMQFWLDETGEDIAEYAVMLAVILVLVVSLVRLIGSNASNIFSQVGSAIQ
jgi:Flp pilus assembly pilin Flp